MKHPCLISAPSNLVFANKQNFFKKHPSSVSVIELQEYTYIEINCAWFIFLSFFHLMHLITKTVVYMLIYWLLCPHKSTVPLNKWSCLKILWWCPADNSTEEGSREDISPYSSFFDPFQRNIKALFHTFYSLSRKK